MFFKEYIFFIRRFILAAFLIFIFAAILGYFSVQSFPKETETVLEELMQKFKPIIEASSFDQFLIIFLNNSFIAFSAIFLGLIFGIFPFLILFFNGFVLGIMLYLVQSTAGWLAFLNLIFPHGIIEVPAAVLACAVGLKLGKVVLEKILKKEVSIRKELSRALIFFFGFLLPLLAIAAAVEVLSIGRFL